MGWNSVAMILNDRLGDLAADPHAGEMIATAVRGINSNRRGDNNFRYGQVISHDHADGYQVVVVHGNTGWRLRDSDPNGWSKLGWQALDQMAEALTKHGYRVTKMRKAKVQAAP